MPTTRIAQPSASARVRRRSGRTHSLGERRGDEDRDAIGSGHRMVVDADDVRQRTTVRPQAEQPITAKPANARDGGDDEDRRAPRAARAQPLKTDGLPVRCEFPVRRHTAAAASSTSPMCTTNVSCSGCGRVLDQQAGQQRAQRRDRRCWPPSPPPPRGCANFCGAASMTAAVAVPVKMPADSPDSTRPTSNSGTRVGDQEHRRAGQREGDRLPATAAAGRRRPTSGRRPAVRTARRPHTSRR